MLLTLFTPSNRLGMSKRERAEPEELIQSDQEFHATQHHVQQWELQTWFSKTTQDQLCISLVVGDGHLLNSGVSSPLFFTCCEDKVSLSQPTNVILLLLIHLHWILRQGDQVAARGQPSTAWNKYFMLWQARQTSQSFKTVPTTTFIPSTTATTKSF